MAPFKVSFTTKNAQVNAESVLELCNIHADNLNEMDEELQADEQEPDPGAKDESMPQQAIVNYKPPPVVIKTMQLGSINNLQAKPPNRKANVTPKQRGLMKSRTRQIPSNIFGGSLRLGTNESILDEEDENKS